MRLILASASPRRAELLTAAGFRFEVASADIDERCLDGEAPTAYVERLAVEKAARAFARMGEPADVVVLAADTAVVVDGEILGKPRDLADSARMLRRLSGRTHEVLTGVCARTAGDTLAVVESTAVRVVALSEADVAWYVASGEGMDKAGGYGIQGLASRFVARIEGSYSNVVGLPVAVVTTLLTRLGALAPVLASEG